MPFGCNINKGDNMNVEKCFVFAAGEYYKCKRPDVDGYVVAADAGYKKLEEWGITPDAVIGDFDSAQRPENVDVIQLNPVKDETDTWEAVRLGLERGCTDFYIYGGTGGRSDHTFANIQLVTMLAKKGVKARLFGNGEIMTVIHNSSIAFSEDSQGMVSVFSLCEKSEGVSEKGLKYLLDGYDMTNDYAIGVSNEFIGERAEISVKKGTLLVMYTDRATVE